MKTEANNNSKLTFKIVKMGIIGGLSLTVVYFGLLYIFGVKFLREGCYGSYFYAWRLRFADKLMTHGRYKYIKKKEHPETNDRKKFYKIAQDEDGKAYLTRFDRPEHYPREFDYQFTLLDKFPEYESFLEARQNYIAKTEGLEDKLDLKGEDLKKEIKEREKMKKEVGELFFADAPGKLINDISEIIFPEGAGEENPWKGASHVMMEVISRVLDGDKHYSFDGKKASPKLIEAINKGVKALGRKELSDEEINDFFIHNGRVSASPMETFIYSRLYFIFYFMTSGVEFKAKAVSELQDATGSDAKQKFYEARMMYVANIFARIFSSIYKNGHKGEEDTKLLEKLRSYYSPYKTVKLDPIEEGDLEILKTSINDYLKETR